MKTLVFSMLAMAAMVSCTSESDPIIDGPDAAKVEIKATAGILKVETKAPVTGNALTGVQILRKDGADATGTWETTPIGVDIVNASTNIFASNPQYYMLNKAKNAYFIGFYPAGTVAENTVTFGTMTGKEDVLLSSLVEAGNKSAIKVATFDFQHKLTLLKFTFIQGTGYPAGDVVKSVTVKGAELPASINLSDGTITYTTSNATAGIPAFTSKSYNIIEGEGTGISDEDALMIEPDKDLSLEIVTNNGTFTVGKIKIGDNEGNKTVPGSQYNVKLTFTATSINAIATIASWGTPLEGSGTVQ